MDINDLRSIITVVSFLTFIGIVCWAWSGRRKTDFDAAALLPLEDDTPLPLRDHTSAGRHSKA